MCKSAKEGLFASIWWPPGDVCRRGTCAQCQYSFWAKVIIVSNLKETSGQQKSLGRKRQCWYSSIWAKVYRDRQRTELWFISRQLKIGSMNNYLRKARMFERVASRITFFLKRASLNSKKSFLPPAFMRLYKTSIKSINRYKTRSTAQRDPHFNFKNKILKAVFIKLLNKMLSKIFLARPACPR